MKVLIISTVRFRLNGITSVIMNYYKQLVKKGYQFDFVVNGYIEPGIEREFLENGSKLYRIHRNQNPLKYMIQLYQILKKNKYDVVHVHGNSATMAIDLLPAKISRCENRISHCHATGCEHRILHYLLNPILKNCYTNALACSDKAGDWIFGRGNYMVLPNGIHVNEYHFSERIRKEVRKELKLEGKFVIGHVGFMNQEKNHPKLFEIMEYMKSNTPNIHLLCITGSVEEKIPKDIKSLIREKGLDENITVLYQRNDVNRLMQAMDVFVLPSRREGLGIVLLEAQATGLPCVASNQVPEESNISGEIEFVDLDAGISEWSDAIRRAFSKNKNRVQYYDAVEKSVYNIENCCQLLEEVYSSG